MLFSVKHNEKIYRRIARVHYPPIDLTKLFVYLYNNLMFMSNDYAVADRSMKIFTSSSQGETHDREVTHLHIYPGLLLLGILKKTRVMSNTLVFLFFIFERILL